MIRSFGMKSLFKQQPKQLGTFATRRSIIATATAVTSGFTTNNGTTFNHQHPRNFSLSMMARQQQEQQQQSQQSSSSGGGSSFKKLLKTSFLLSLGISAVAILLSVRQYNQEPNDSMLDKIMKNMYGPYRNYVQLTTEQPNIEETLVYNNEMLSFDASNSATTTTADSTALSNLFVKPGLLIKEEIHNVGGNFEIFDDYGHTLDVIWMLMSRDEYNKASSHVDSGSREQLLSGDDFEMLESSINRGLNKDEEVIWMERINSKNMVSSKEYTSLPENIKNKPNCVVAIIKTPDAYAHKSDYFETRYGAEAAKKISSPPNRDLYRVMVLTSYFNYFIAIGRAYPNQMINFDLARKDLSRDEIEKILSFIPESQKPTFNAIARKSTSKSYEVIRDLRETALKLYADRLTLKAPPQQQQDDH